MTTFKRSLYICLFCILLLTSFGEVIAQEDNCSAKSAQATQFQFSNAADIRWNPEGTRLAIVAYPSIFILDAESLEIDLTISDAHVSKIIWNASGNQIAAVTGGNPGSLFIWDANTGEKIKHLTRHYPEFVDGVVLPMFEPSWSPDNSQITSDSPALDVLLWDLETKKVTVLGSHDSGRIGEIDWSPDGTQVVSGGGDGSIRIWDTATGKNMIIIEGGGSVDWHPTDNRILGSATNNKAVIWDSKSGHELLTFTHEAYPLLVRWNNDGTMIATGALDGAVNVWNATTGERIYAFRDHSDFIMALDWHPNQNLIASVSYDDCIIIWNLDELHS